MPLSVGSVEGLFVDVESDNEIHLYEEISMKTIKLTAGNATRLAQLLNAAVRICNVTKKVKGEGEHK